MAAFVRHREISSSAAATFIRIHRNMVTKEIHHKEGFGQQILLRVKYEYKYDRFSARQGSPDPERSYSLRLFLVAQPRLRVQFRHLPLGAHSVVDH